MTDHSLVIEDDPEEVLRVLADGDCRALLEAADTPMTASELAAESGIPLSTTYRKLDRTAAAGLIEESYRYTSVGRHPRQYQRRSEDIRVRLPRGE